MRFNHWNIDDNIEIKKKTQKVTAVCDCGTIRTLEYRLFASGRTKSCGCKKKESTIKTNMERYGVPNASSTKEVRERVKQTNIEKYGVESLLSCKNMQEKIKQTNLEKYGSKYATQNESVKKRAKQTNLEKYGVEYASQSKQFKDKIKKTSQKKYGTDNPLQSEIIKKQIKKTNLEKYGVEYGFQAESVIEKIKQTNLQRYGIENPSGIQSIREKAKQTNIKRYGFAGALKNKEIKQKSIETSLLRYGTENPSQSTQIKEKKLQTYISNDWTSAGERELRDWISNSFTKYHTEKSYCGGATPCEIDILVKNSDNSNILAIEYNGDYFHSEARSGNRTSHAEKSEIALKQKECHLIHIFESEWSSRNLAVVSFLGSKLSQQKTARASKCQVRLVPFDEAREFCETFHMQGHPNSIHLALGLYLGNELLSLATFSKPHRQNMTSELHLSRFVTKPTIKVHGGLSKLSKRAFQLLGPFVTFVHKRLSNGNSYEKAGYKKIKEIPPDYWYWDCKDHKTVSKQSRRKSAVNTPKDMTEREHAIQDNLYRIWDCGKIKFIFNPE